jgi:acetolactate synthase regulatory subunit
MPRDTERVALTISMNRDERETVNRTARRRGFNVVADYVRALIEKDAKAHGEDFTFEVDRGGWRGGERGKDS